MNILKVLLIALFPVLTFAADPSFTSITDDDLKEISKGMGSNFSHSALMGASKLGTVFGFQVGLVAAQTTTPKLDDIANRSGGDLKNLYNAGLMGAVGIPLGISFEAVVIPTMKSNGASLKSSSFALKWNINDVIPILPVNLALRGVSSSAEFSFDQTVSSTTQKIKSSTDVTGVQLLFSPQLPVVEPYIGVGTLSSDSSLEGPSAIFSGGSGLTSTERSKKVTGTQILGGVEVNLLLLKLGLEYSKAFDNSKVGFKLSFGF